MSGIKPEFSAAELREAVNGVAAMAEHDAVAAEKRGLHGEQLETVQRYARKLRAAANCIMDEPEESAEPIEPPEIINADGTIDPKNFKSSWLYKYLRFADGRVLFCDACDWLRGHKDIADAHPESNPISAGSIQVKPTKRWAIADSGSTTLKLHRGVDDQGYIAKELGPDFIYDIEVIY